MIDYASQLDPWALLIICSILGTIFAYLQKYAWAKPRPVSMSLYLFGDLQAVMRVIIKLLGAIGGAILFDMPANMDTTAILALGLAIGIAIPEQLASEEIRRLNDQKIASRAALPKAPTNRDESKH